MLSLLHEFESFFNYGAMAKTMWREKMQAAQKELKIYFDLENDDPIKGKERDIIVPQDYWDTTTCKFKCQLCQAGGDWEVPVYYFKCQIIDGYAYGIGTHGLHSFIIYIPGKMEGNYHLLRTRKNDGWRAPHNGDEYKKGIDPEANERDCWRSLEKFLKKLVDLEIQKIQNERAQEELNKNSVPEPEGESQKG